MQLLAAGTCVGSDRRYRIEQRLGQGGFGEVYLSTDLRLSRRCVVKRMYDSGTFAPAELRRRADAFIREAQLLITLNHPGHPNIPEIYDVMADDVCLAMKYIEGRSLQGNIDRIPSGGLSEAIALRYARDICSALAYMHAKSPAVIHRDIKPENLLVDSLDRSWLVDFGLSQSYTKADGAVSSIGGTFGYSAPEQLRGAAEPQSDIFALGRTLHVLLVNPPRPFVSTTATAQGPRLTRPLPPIRSINEQIRPEVEALIARCCAVDPEERPDAQELLAELSALVQSPTLPPPPDPEPVPTRSGFVGRVDELANYRATLAQTGVVTLIGPPGIGKSALAAHVALKLAPREMIFWHTCRLAEGRAATLLWGLAGFLARSGRPELWRWLHVASQPGTRLPPPDVFARALIEQLRDSHLLICLDDADLLDTDPDAEPLLHVLLEAARSRAIGLILTGRDAPIIVKPLAGPALSGLDRAAARLLFEQAQIPLSDSLLETLYVTVDGNPQFLLLATAAIQQGAHPDSLVAQLPQADLVSDYLLNAVDRRLSERERAVLQTLALLREPATLDAVEATLDQDGMWAALQQLHDRHLVQARGANDQHRYALHAILAGFYVQQLGRRVRKAMHRRAGEFFEHDERDVIRAAYHANEAGEANHAAALATAECWELINKGQAPALLALLAQLKNAQLDADVHIHVLQAHGEIADLLGAAELAGNSFHEALHILEARPASAERAVHIAQLCRAMGTLLRTRAPTEAVNWVQRGLSELAQPSILLSEARFEQARLYQQLGSIYLVQGNEEEALDVLTRSLALLPTSADRWRANVQANLGVAYCALGEVERGLDYYRDAERTFKGLQDSWGLAVIRHN